MVICGRSHGIHEWNYLINSHWSPPLATICTNCNESRRTMAAKIVLRETKGTGNFFRNSMRGWRRIGSTTYLARGVFGPEPGGSAWPGCFRIRLSAAPSSCRENPFCRKSVTPSALA